MEYQAWLWNVTYSALGAYLCTFHILSPLPPTEGLFDPREIKNCRRIFIFCPNEMLSFSNSYPTHNTNIEYPSEILYFCVPHQERRRAVVKKETLIIYIDMV